MKTNDIHLSDIKTEALILYDMIENVGCYNSKDLMRLNRLLAKISERGIEIKEKHTLSFTVEK